MPVTLNQNGPNPTQMLAAKDSVLSMFSQVSKLRAASNDNQALASFLRLRASETMTNVYGEDDEDRISQEMGDKATNLARMKFCLAGAAAAKSKGDQQALEMELLRAALYFGASQAGQALLEANEAGVIALTEAEICDIVKTMIFWREEAQKTNSPVPQDVQILPALINLKKAWAAVYKKPELFNQLLEVAYLRSGLDCQAMLNANEAGTIKLTHAQARRLIEQQIKWYREVSVSASREEAMKHAPKLLTQANPWATQPKAWAAIQDNAKEMNALLNDFNHFLTTQLPEAGKVGTLENLAATTESEPGRFVGHFEDPVTQANVKKNAEFFEADKAFNNLRANNLLALVELRHEVAKPLVREIYEMRPTIVKKREKNDIDDKASADRISAEKARLDEEDAADLLVSPDPKVTIRYIGGGKKAKENNTLSAIYTAARNIGDTTIGKPTVESRVDFNKKVEKASAADQARYAARLKDCEDIHNAYLNRNAERAVRLENVKANEKVASDARAAELQALKDQETALIAAFEAMNPLATCKREVIFAMTRDLAVYGTVTHDWLMLLARMVAEDAYAYRTGTKDQFGYDGVKGVKTKNERMPVFIAANEPVELAMLQLFFEANPGLADKKNLSDFTNKTVLEAFLKKMQDGLLDANGQVITVDPTDFLENHFPLDEVTNINTPAKKAARREETAVKIASNTVRARAEDPALIAIERLKLAALSLTVTQLFPKADAAHAEVIRYTDIHSTRLNKLVAGMDVASHLRNYFVIALVALHNSDAMQKLKNLQDTNNSLFQYGVKTMSETVQSALGTVARTNYRDIGIPNLDSAAILLAYLNQELSAVSELAYLLTEGALIRLEAEIKTYNQKGVGAYNDSDEVIALKTATEANREKRLALVTHVNGSERRESITVDTTRRNSTTTPSPVTSVSNTPVKQVESVEVSSSLNVEEKVVTPVQSPVAPVVDLAAERAKMEAEAKAKEAEMKAKLEAEAKAQQNVVTPVQSPVAPVVDLDAERAKIETEMKAKIEAEMRAQMEVEAKAKEAEMKAKLQAEKEALEASRKAQEAEQRKLQLEQQKIASEKQQLEAEKQSLASNNTSASDEDVDNIGPSFDPTAMLQPKRERKATVMYQHKTDKAKPPIGQTTYNGLSAQEQAQYAQMGATGAAGLFGALKGAMDGRRGSMVPAKKEEESDSDNEWSDDESKKPVAAKPVAAKPVSPIQPPPPPKAMFAAPVVAESSSSEPKKLNIKAMGAMLNFGGAKPSDPSAAPQANAAKPAAPVAKPGVKKPSKWGVIETSSVALTPEQAAQTTVPRPSLAGLFGNIAPTDNGNVLAAINKPGSGSS